LREHKVTEKLFKHEPEKAFKNIDDYTLHFALEVFMIACEMKDCNFAFLLDLLGYLSSKVSSAISSSTNVESEWGDHYKKLCVGFVKKVRVSLVKEFCMATQIEDRFS